jgi:hypothetical protein
LPFLALKMPHALIVSGGGRDRDIVACAILYWGADQRVFNPQPIRICEIVTIVAVLSEGWKVLKRHSLPSLTSARRHLDPNRTELNPRFFQGKLVASGFFFGFVPLECLAKVGLGGWRSPRFWPVATRRCPLLSADACRDLPHDGIVVS